MLATFLVFSIEISRSAGCTRSAQAQRKEEVLFGLKIKRAGKIMLSTVQIHPYEQINGWREIADRRSCTEVSAMDSTHIVCREDSSHPSRGRVARDLVASAFRHSGVQGVRFHVFYISKPRTPKAKSAQSQARSITKQPQSFIHKRHLARD
jgi:hypothetical protein